VRINSPHIAPGEPIGDLPAAGVLGGYLIGQDIDGKSMVEYVLPNRFPGGPTVPFEASWWTVEPGRHTAQDEHEAQELWLIASGAGQMRLGTEHFEVRAGQAVYVPASQRHSVRAIGTEDLVVFSVWWK